MADWTVICLHAAPRVQPFASTAIDGHIVRCGIVSSYQSAATFEIVKRFWTHTSLTHVSSDVAIAASIYLYLYF